MCAWEEAIWHWFCVWVAWVWVHGSDLERELQAWQAVAGASGCEKGTRDGKGVVGAYQTADEAAAVADTGGRRQ